MSAVRRDDRSLLTMAERDALLALARRSVEVRVTAQPASLDVPPGFPAASGVFVTVKVFGELRGCLGRLASPGDLANEVMHCAAEAASEDPRFTPVGPEELVAVSIQISVLGPLEPIDPRDHESFVIGEHGLVVERGRRRGLLLPQVAVEWGWTREQFLRQTCLKAELAPDAWRQNARVFRFTAEVFGD